VTLPSGGNNPPISINDLNTEFGRGFNLNAYRNTRWYKEDNSRGFFSAGVIDLDDFYGTRVNSPVVAGSATLTRAAWNNVKYSIPMFNNLSVTTYSGTGGTAGQAGDCNGGGAGGTGGSTSFGGNATTGTGAAGAYGASTTAVTGSASWSINDSNQASIIAMYGTMANALTIGAGGTAGTAGAYNQTITVCYQYGYADYPFICTGAYSYVACTGPQNAGSAGSPGYISVSWS